MIAIIASLLACAFPDRGSVWKPLDSSLVLERDTIVVKKENCTCLCPSYSYTVVSTSDTTRAVQPFPGTRDQVYHGQIAGQTGRYVGPSGNAGYSCDTKIFITALEQRKFLFKGKDRTWAILADSVVHRSSSPSQSSEFRVRWRWSRVDTTLPWVRWADTIRLDTKESPLGLPVLSPIRPFRPEVLFPQSAMAGFTLILEAGQDPSKTIRWGSINGRDSNPEGELPVGWTFRVAKVASPTTGTVQWLVRAEDGASDKLFTQGKGEVFSSSRPRPPAPSRSHAIDWEPATGRRALPDAVVPPRLRILSSPEGTRLESGPRR